MGNEGAKGKVAEGQQPRQVMNGTNFRSPGGRAVFIFGKEFGQLGWDWSGGAAGVFCRLPPAFGYVSRDIRDA